MKIQDELTRAELTKLTETLSSMVFNNAEQEMAIRNAISLVNSIKEEIEEDDYKVKANVYKATVLIVDTEDMAEEEVKNLLECTKYIYPSILSFEKREVMWDDEHPLNHEETQAAEVERLFNS